VEKRGVAFRGCVNRGVIAALMAIVVGCSGGDEPPEGFKLGRWPDGPADVPRWGPLATTNLVPRGSVWRYLDNGTNQGTAWREPGFDDTGWRTGAAQLGYGEGDEATTLGYGPDPNNKYVTNYFRRSFVVSEVSPYQKLTLRLLRDDGAIVYLNGIEVFRTNLPGGTIDYRTLALTATVDENVYFEVALDARTNPALLRSGTNVLAVEVHQSWYASSDLSFDLELMGEPATGPTPPGPIPSAFVSSHLDNYGPWDAAGIATAWRHGLVITHPRQSQLTRSIVSQIQLGADGVPSGDDVKVICYVSIGEDLRSAGVTDEQARVDPRFIGDGTGPRIDPRGPNADGMSLAGIDPRGVPSSGGGFASFYLDDNSVDRNGVGDGIPDRNQVFNAFFVNAGDPNWFPVVDAMTLDGGDGQSGLREAMTLDYGRGLGCDGVFLDTLDTAAPNQYTDANSFNQSEFEWTAPGFSDFVRRVRAAYPSKLIVQNRGLFFLDPRHPQYQFSTRAWIDYLFFESFRLDSTTGHQFDPYFFPDNNYNVGPKLLAEAGRGAGFQILSLGYAEGPPTEISTATLLGQSTLGLESLLEDIRITEDRMGFRHYLTNGLVSLVNPFVLEHHSMADTEPPVWTSSFNDRNPGFPAAPEEPTARPGIREAIPGPGQVTVRWDIARDKFPVRYALYYQTQPFDFANDPELTAATRVELAPQVPLNYPGFGGPNVYANEASVGGLAANQTYYLVIRAHDLSPARHEERNQIVLSVTPTP
jgi:hypothetical protein